jgi:murein L,D-transpeptidase YcbB/YkuD
MTTRKTCSGLGATFATVGLTTALALAAGPADAGIFSWLGGKNQNQNQGQSTYQDQGTYQAPPPERGGGWFGGGRANRQPVQPAQPGSRALGGNSLPPLEGTAATREWITNPALGLPTLSSANVAATKAAIAHYQAIVAQGGWPMVPEYAMRPGSQGSQVEALKRRLELSGDLSGSSVPNEYDAATTEAVRTFQRRHGIPPTGVIDRNTIDALNVPATVRLHQLQANLKRLQTLSPKTGGRYVVVNIPAAQVEAVENGYVASRHAAVVGKLERATPEITSKVQEINFNPYWNVPKTIVVKDLVPKGRAMAQNGQDMLAAYHMQAFTPQGQPVDSRSIDWNGEAVYNYSFRQLPWAENSLGFVKINFPNKDAVYLHDTPLKSLFGRSVRFESSGCVRVHNVEGLVTWILRDNPGWTLDRVMAMKQTGEQADVKLTKPVPIYLAYVSAWGTPDGTVNFRPDIYGIDGAAQTASAY